MVTFYLALILLNLLSVRVAEPHWLDSPQRFLRTYSNRRCP